MVIRFIFGSRCRFTACCAAMAMWGWAVQPVLAQQGADFGKARRWYDRETIHMKGASAYVKDNRLYYGRNNLRREFSISPGGMQLYLRSRKNRTVGTVISFAGALGSVTALINGDRRLIRTFFWVGLGTGAASGLLTMQANNQLGEAVWLRNRDALLLLEDDRADRQGR